MQTATSFYQILQVQHQVAVKNTVLILFGNRSHKSFISSFFLDIYDRKGTAGLEDAPIHKDIRGIFLYL